MQHIKEQMQEKQIAKITAGLKLGLGQVAATVALLDSDAKVPFIARFRKEATGSLDEVAITGDLA